MLQTAPAAEASAWLDSFSRQLAGGDADAVLELFAEDCYWRDLVAFTWNVKTMEGKAAIKAMLDATLASTAPTSFVLGRRASRARSKAGSISRRHRVAAGACSGCRAAGAARS